MSKKQVREQQKDSSYVEKRHDDRIRYAYFARYMMVRYFVIAFFFANVFWLILSYSAASSLGMLLATVATVWSTVSVLEQLSKLHDQTTDVPKTRWYLIFQIGLNLALIVSLLTPLKKKIYPFVTTSSSSLALISILLVGIIAAWTVLLRIRNIRLGKDKYLAIIRNAENSHALDQE
ncbi:PTS cellobiose transporter subunit IIA [Lactobacillus porci]|uniref:PTS cellobiose transporter subunit IIA n=1 Tax=Lactobacillus porci TaxID=2012477 RepID=UPI003994D288